MAKVYSLTIRNRAAAVVIAIAILGLGAVFLTVGLALLAGLAVAGGVLGAGYALVHRLRGTRLGTPQSLAAMRDSLDPSLEIQPVRPAVVAPRKDDPA
jgi:hypothetical protein